MHYFYRLLAATVSFCLVTSVHATVPPIGFEGADCIFPEDPDQICSGQHPGDATTAAPLQPVFYNTFFGGLNQARGSRQGVGALVRGDENLAGNFVRGQAAGDHGLGLSAWANYSVTETDNTFAATRFQSSQDVFMIGADITPFDTLIIGGVFGYESNDVKTVFNAGAQDISGYTLAAYAGYLVTDFMSVDVAGGFSNIDIDQTRIDSTNFTNTIRGDTDSDRLFASANLNLFTTYGDLAVTGRTGFIVAKEEIDAVIESGGPDAFNSAARTVEFGQILAGAEVAWIGEMFEPYAARLLHPRVQSPGCAAEFSASPTGQ